MIGDPGMIPFKKILCPSDFSDPSYNALVMADKLAKSLDAELFVLHIVPTIPLLYYPSPMGPDEYVDFNVVTYQDALLKEAHRKMDSVVEEKISPEVKVHKVVLQGAAAEEIVKYAEAAGVDLIVISTHGNTGLNLLVFGSVADKVVRSAECPVLTMRRQDARS
ncbi:MAG: universal stress protein [Candidatus Eremiobacteraeota bacterium]|nr:universal stress protein [Candidatus Eremiobacteraeota bacterium]